MIRRRVRAGACDGAVTRISRRPVVPFLVFARLQSVTTSVSQPVSQPFVPPHQPSRQACPLICPIPTARRFLARLLWNAIGSPRPPSPSMLGISGLFRRRCVRGHSTYHAGHSTQDTGKDTEHRIQGTALAQEKLCRVGKLRETSSKC